MVTGRSAGDGEGERMDVIVKGRRRFDLLLAADEVGALAVQVQRV